MEKLTLGERGGRKRFPINQDYSKMLGCHGNCSERVSQPHLWLQGSSVNAKALQTPQTQSKFTHQNLSSPGWCSQQRSMK